MPPADAVKIPCPTAQHLQAELATLAAILEPGETEETWDKMERAIIRFSAVVRGGAYKHTEAFLKGVGNKGIGLDLVDCMMSDRGRLSGAATELVQTFAPRMGTHFHSLVLLYLPPLVRLLARPNKVYIKRAEKCLTTIISHCPLPSIILHLRNGLDEKSDTCKRVCSVAIENAMAEWDAARWHEKDLDVLELCVRKMATDKDAQVRKTGKAVWASFREIWPERVDDFVGPLTPTVRRYLDLPPAESGGPSRSKAVPRLALGRTAGNAPSHPSGPPAAGPSKLQLSTGSDKDKEARTRTPSATSALSGGAQRIRSETTDSRPTSDRGRSRALEPLPSGPRLVRSVSSNVPPVASSSNPKPTLSGKPTRPTPHPVDNGAGAAPGRRLPLPHRPVRPVEDDSRSARTRSVSAQSQHSSSSTTSSKVSRKQVSTTSTTSTPSSVVSDGHLPSPSDTSETPCSTSDPSRTTGVRARVTEIERKASQHGTPKHPTPNRDQQLAAGIPLPQDTPLNSKAPGNAYSPSLSMLLGRNKLTGDGDLTLADLSVDHGADTPVVQRFSGLPASATSSTLSATPSSSRPSPVSHLINRFSTTPVAAKTPSETPTPQEAQTPTPSDERRISPLPKRVTDVPAATDSLATPPRSKKRKGCDLEELVQPTSLIGDTPFKPSPAPLISFWDSPAPAQPFRFGSGPVRPRESIFSALMGLAMDAPQTEAIEEEKEGDDTVRLELADTQPNLMDIAEEPAQSNLVEIADEPAQPSLVDIADEPESDYGNEGDRTAMFVPNATEEPEVLSEAELVELSEPEQAAEIQAEVISKTPADVTPATPEIPVEEAAPLSTSDPAPPTPLPKILAEFDELTETEDDVDADVDEAAHGKRVSVQETTFIVADENMILQQRAVVVEQTGSSAELALPSPPMPSNASAEASEDAEPEQKVEPELEVEEAADALVDTSEPVLSPEQPSQLEEMKVFEEPSVDLLKVSTGSSVPGSEAGAETTTEEAHSKPKVAERRPKLAARRPRDAPVEHKSFRPVSRLHETKGAPAPARVATRSSATAPTAASAAKAPSMSSSTSSSAAPTRARKPAAPQIVTASKPAPPVAAKAAPTLTKTTGSSLFKPTAATAARAAATAAATTAHAEAKEKETKDLLEVKEKPTSRPVSSQGHVRPAAPKATRPTGGAFGSTAASRAREAALPPVKRSRLKLKAPQESFRPGRTGSTRTNRSKASVLGSATGAVATASGRARRPIRPVRGVVDETFPIPGPDPRTSFGQASPQKAGEETSPQKVEKAPEAEKENQDTKPTPLAIPKRSSTLAVPSFDAELNDASPRTPNTGGFSPVCISPASSRHTSYTSHSDISCGSRPSPSKLKMAPPRPLDPVLTPTHSANVSAISSFGQAALVAPVADSPAVMHARRVSGIPASLKKTIAEETARRRANSSMPSEDEKHDEENADDILALGANRHDVCTSSGKAASLLTRFTDERRVLTPRDSNSRQEL